MDDVEASAQTLAMMLRAVGQSVMTVHNGQAAIDWAVAHTPEVVFLDIGMPVMSGYEVARRLRENTDLAATVLIALTGYGQEEDRRQAFAAGFDHHMVKPTSIYALEEMLRSLPANNKGLASPMSNITADEAGYGH